MRKTIVFVGLITFTLSLFGGECKNGAIKFYNDGVPKIEMLPICFKKIGNQNALISEKCLMGSCLATQQQKAPIVFTKYSMQGNPSFRLCKAVGGNPQLIEYKTEDIGFTSYNRCLFPDGSFVQTDYLYVIHQKYIVPDSNSRALPHQIK